MTTYANGEPLTPQHDIARTKEAERNTIGDFMSWLHDVKHLSLGEWNTFTGLLGPYDKFEPVRGMTGPEFERLLAEFIGVDYDAYQAEKEAVYKFVSEQANARL